MGDPNLCPNCPYVSFIPLIKAEQVSYTRQKEELTAMKLCQKMRALALKRHWVFQTCKYFPTLETMERFIGAEAEVHG